MKLLTNTNQQPAAWVSARSMETAARKRVESPLQDTPFGRGFMDYSGMDPDKHFSAAYAAMAIGISGFRHAVVRAVYGTLTQVRRGAFSMDATDRNYETLFETPAGALGDLIRVRRGRNKVTMSIPVGNISFESPFYPSTNWAQNGALLNGRATINALVENIQRSKFRNLLAFDQALDVSLTSDEVLALTPAEDYSERTVGRNTPGYPRLFTQCFPRFRFLRAAPLEAMTQEGRRGQFGTNFGTNMPKVDASIQHPAFQNDDVAREYLTACLSMPVVGFIEADFDAEFIRELTGFGIEDVPLSQVGAWGTYTFDFQLSGGDGNQADIYKSSSLAASKAESESQAVLPFDPAGMGENRLSVDSEGDYYYLPVVDIVEEYEASVETTYVDEKGDWTLRDPKNPRNITKFVDAEGRERQQPRKLPSNRLLYTDFRAGLISYTGSGGQLTVRDISSFRPCTYTHIRDLLEADVVYPSNRHASLMTMLGASIREAIAMFPTEAAVSRREETVAELGLNDYQSANLETLHQNFLRGQSSVGFYVDELIRMVRVAGDRVPQAVADKLEEGTGLYLISPTSPLPPMRTIYEVLSLYAQHLLENFEVASTKYSPMPALNRMGVLLALVRYAPDYDQVVAKDREERAAYIDPVEDYRTTELPEIPFAKGVRLMPHQVKLFNKLKRFPRRFVLDVAAGGGKTFSAILVAGMYMKGVGVRKPIVVCPNILLKNYFEDGAYATAGAMNIIAVNGEVIRRWGTERLATLIREAPINTIVVASFESMAKMDERMYATRKVRTNSVVEFLKQFDFDFAVVDESHRIKNPTANTNKNVMRLLNRAKYSGIMTGTLVYDTTLDLVGQFSLMDPSIFGSMSYFKENYMETRGGISRARGDAPAMVKEAITERTAYVKIGRKEWAALLPPRKDEFNGEPTEAFHILNDPEHPSEPGLTQAQRDYYDLMLAEVKEQIEREAQGDESLRRLLAAVENGGGEDEEGDDEETLDAAMKRLNPYLQRLEIFIANPLNHREVDFTSRLTNPADRVSPKAKKVAMICKDHIDRGYVGKILVFTQYNESAEGIFNSLPPALKSRAVHYTAGNKNTLQQFQSDPNIVILVGNERSIGTGLNLQMASRIIRTESTWNWGAMEQAEARVNRPMAKSKETRKALYLDWIVVNGTVDVTKISRMISKGVEAYKFNYAGNQAFDEMEALEPVKLSLKNILYRNDIHDEDHNVQGHFGAYQLCRALEQAEFDEFLADPNVRTEDYELAGGPLPGSALLKNVPYVAGMDLYGKEELGLQPLISYVTATAHSTLSQFDPTELLLHTDMGDGTCRGFRRNRAGELSSVTVELPDGTKETFDISSVFVVTRPSADLDVRKTLAEHVMGVHTGKKVVLTPMQAPLRVPPAAPAVPVADEATPNRGKIKILRTAPVPNTDNKANKAWNMYAMSVGHSLCLNATMEDPDVPVEVLTAEGFHEIPTYWFARFKTPEHLRAWYTKISRYTGFAPDSRKQIEEIMGLLERHLPDAFFQNLTPNVLRNFWLDLAKPPKAGTIRPFVSVEDNGTSKRPYVYVVVPLKQNPTFRPLVSRAAVPGVEWDHTEDLQYWYLSPNKRDALKKLAAVNAQAPIKNYNNLVAKINQLRMLNAK